MERTVIKNICHVLKVFAWIVLTVFLATRENDTFKTFSIIGTIAIACFFVQFCSCCDMYINCKKKYLLIRDINKMRRNDFAKGDFGKVVEYTEDIEVYGEEALELGNCLLKDSMWIPKKKIEIMTQDIRRMMKQKYPPL